MVYCGLFPSDAAEFEDLREALGRLQLNDAALQFEPEVATWARPCTPGWCSACSICILSTRPSRMSCVRWCLALLTPAKIRQWHLTVSCMLLMSVCVQQPLPARINSLKSGFKSLQAAPGGCTGCCHVWVGPQAALSACRASCAASVSVNQGSTGTETQRARQQLRMALAGVQRHGFWLPLRLPGPAAHGDRPGAPGAGVRPGPHHHSPHGGLQVRPH